ncbi:MAG: pilus assembly protein N-terminal domain-containing protein [Hyphomicrobiaceae bacterium]|nr:pilus assembly protein N-terminal domain-containing protein [Hyphomicrobiaceae bacterium]
MRIPSFLSLIVLAAMTGPVSAQSAATGAMPAEAMPVPPLVEVEEAGVGSTIRISLDHARVLRLTEPVGTIIIGNPAIADAAMPDDVTLILTGRSYGETNLIMMDQNGVIVAENTILVGLEGGSLVSVYRRTTRSTLSCSPICQIRPTPGDDPEQVNAGFGAFEARNTQAVGAAGGGQTR